MKILEIGVGNKKEYPDSIGIDRVKTKFVDKVVDLEKGKLPFRKNSFDLVTANHVLEHIQNLIPLLREVHRVLKPGGNFIVNVPHFSHDGAYSDPTHVRFFGYRTFDYFQPKFEIDYNFDFKFRIVKKRIDWDRKPKWLNSILSSLINLKPTIYERYFCWLLPTHNVYFELNAIK